MNNGFSHFSSGVVWCVHTGVQVMWAFGKEKINIGHIFELGGSAGLFWDRVAGVHVVCLVIFKYF